MVNKSVSEPSCRLCSSRLTRTFVDLGMLPVCERQLGQMEAGGAVEGALPRCAEARPRLYYPLHALVCEVCFLVQLSERVSPSGTIDPSWPSAFVGSHSDTVRSYCHMLTERLQLGRHSLVVEVASKDGFLLQHFRPLGVPVLGIERATNETEAVHRSGFPTLSGCFGSALAGRLVAGGKRADLIIANNILAQVSDPNDFIAGMASLLAPEGTIVLEYPHLERLIAETQFDTMCHSHLSYFSLTTASYLAKRNGLKIIDVERLRVQGGALRLYLTHAGSARPCSSQVAVLHKQEIAAGLLDVSTYAEFSEQVRRAKRNLLAFLITAKNQGKSICGYGATKGANVLLNSCAIGTDMLDFVATDDPYNYDRFMPGTHIPINPLNAIDATRPDYVLLLQRHLKNHITQRQLRRINNWGGRLVIPIPEISFIESIRIVS